MFRVWLSIDWVFDILNAFLTFTLDSIVKKKKMQEFIGLKYKKMANNIHI